MDVREKLVDIVCEATQINGCIHSCNHPPCAMVRGIVDALIENGVTVQEWISVDDKLPEESGYYLVVYRDKYNESISIDFDMYVKCNAGEWWESEFACDITKQFLWATRLQDQEVTHWMPFPCPPKGE